MAISVESRQLPRLLSSDCDELACGSGAMPAKRTVLWNDAVLTNREVNKRGREYRRKNIIAPRNR